MTNLDRVLKSRDITLLSKVRMVKAMVFPVVMYGCETWTIKKDERWRIDAFKLWCWRRLLRFPWTARISNQSILKKINPEYSLEELMLKLNSNTLTTWCESWIIRKDPDAGNDWKLEEKGMTEHEMIGWHHWSSGPPSLGDGEGQGSLVCSSPWGHRESDMTECLNNNNKFSLSNLCTKYK